MRRAGLLVVLVLTLAVVRPSMAQLRASEKGQAGEALMATTESVGLLMRTVFNPQNFSMGHAFEMTVGSSSYGTGSLAMYTNSLQWRFGDKFNAQADVSVAYSPFSNFNGSSLGGPNSVSGRSADVFLRNAFLEYRPSENVSLNLSYHRSPYGRYLQPYGWYRPAY